jgi:hypothetical protein
LPIVEKAACASPDYIDETLRKGRAQRSFFAVISIANGYRGLVGNAPWIPAHHRKLDAKLAEIMSEL